MILPALAMFGASVALLACDDVFGVACTSEMIFSASVQVRDVRTGEPAARGVTGFAEHESGAVTQFAAIDDSTLIGDWQRELPGHHAIRLQKPGYQTEILNVTVPGGRCHVEPVTAHAEISPDPGSVSEDPVSFQDGPKINAWPASAGVQIHGDTLEISGFAPTPCESLRTVAFRTGTGLHVQVEPSGSPLEECASPREFVARFILPAERTYLLVTNGFGFPVELFDGQVQRDP
jgi:hypothetical protein